MDTRIIHEKPAAPQVPVDDPLSREQAICVVESARSLYMSAAPVGALEWEALTDQQRNGYIELVMTARRATVLFPLEVI